MSKEKRREQEGVYWLGNVLKFTKHLSAVGLFAASVINHSFQNSLGSEIAGDQTIFMLWNISLVSSGQL